jgi:hypothetical protein
VSLKKLYKSQFKELIQLPKFTALKIIDTTHRPHAIRPTPIALKRSTTQHVQNKTQNQTQPQTQGQNAQQQEQQQEHEHEQAEATLSDFCQTNLQDLVSKPFVFV